MKKVVWFFALFLLTSSLWSVVEREDIELKTQNVFSRLISNNRSIPYIQQNFFPPNYPIVMNTIEFGVSSVQFEEFDGTTWHDFMKWDFYYDNNGLITAFDQYFYMPSFTVIYYYHDITYDNQNRMIESWMNLDMGGGVTTGSHETYAYGDDGLEHWFLEGDYGVGSYANQEQAYFTYTAGELTEGLYQNWDEDNLVWVDDYRHTFTYDGGLLDTVLYESFDSGQWYNDYYSMYTMINNIRPSEVIQQMWNGNVFENSERFTHTYPRYEFDERLEEDWINGNWMNDGLEQVTYDNNNNPLQVDIFEWDGTEWFETERYLYSYGPISADPNELQVADIQISNHPNPFNPSTTISFILDNAITENSELTIYNLKGQKIISFVQAELIETSGSLNSYSVNWNGTDENNEVVPSGIYFARLKTDNQTASSKMLLLK